MKAIHVPVVNARYWTGITLASVFGTNLGDFYAHESGLGLVQGLAVLAALVAVGFGADRMDQFRHEFYYWLVIIIIRTGATNIADYLAFRLKIPSAALLLGLVALLAAFAWLSQKYPSAPQQALDDQGLPDTNAAYWAAMLCAGVFGTAFGDVCSHLVGEGAASMGLGVVLAAALFLRRHASVGTVGLYWLTVAAARSAGTSIGDWLAENKIINLGLPLSMLSTGTHLSQFWSSGAVRGRLRRMIAWRGNCIKMALCPSERP